MSKEEFEEDSLGTCILFAFIGAGATAVFIGTVIFTLHNLARILGGG